MYVIQYVVSVGPSFIFLRLSVSLTQSAVHSYVVQKLSFILFTTITLTNGAVTITLNPALTQTLMSQSFSRYLLTIWCMTLQRLIRRLIIIHNPDLYQTYILRLIFVSHSLFIAFFSPFNVRCSKKSVQDINKLFSFTSFDFIAVASVMTRCSSTIVELD